MKVLNFRSYQLIAILIASFSFLISVLQAQYIYDGHHWGLMASNAKDLIEEKHPIEKYLYNTAYLQQLFILFLLKLVILKLFQFFMGHH